MYIGIGALVLIILLILLLTEFLAVLAVTMDKNVEFFFYVAAALCFVIAAMGQTWALGRRTRADLDPQLVLLPLGLALWLFPLLWNTGDLAFK